MIDRRTFLVGTGALLLAYVTQQVYQMERATRAAIHLGRLNAAGCGCCQLRDRTAMTSPPSATSALNVSVRARGRGARL